MSEVPPFPSDEMEEIWALFAEDGKEALDAAEDDLLELESAPEDAGRIAGLFRAMHTFKGNARVMGLSSIETLAHRAEDLIALVRDDGVALDGQMIDILLTVLDKLRTLLQHVSASRSDVPVAETESLVAELQAMHTQYTSASQQTAPSPVEPEAEQLAELPPPEPAIDLEPLPELPEFERVDPAADPIYVQIFIELAQEEFARFFDALNTLSAGNEDAVAEITAVADTLYHAAEQMSYHRFQTGLNLLVDAATKSSGEERIEQLTQIRLQLEALLIEYAGDLPVTISKPDAQKSGVDWQETLIDDSATQEFLTKAHGELPGLHSNLLALSEGDNAADVAQKSRETIEVLRQDAHRLGYARIVAALDNLTSFTALSPDAAGIFRLLQEAELTLFEELSVIQEAANLPEVNAEGPNFSWLFRHWHAENVFADLARLREIVDELNTSNTAWPDDMWATTNIEALAAEATRLLRAIYQSCIFYKLIQATHISLALEDIYARIAQKEMALNDPLLSLTKSYVTQLGGTISDIREGETPDTAALEAMIPQAEEILFLQTEDRSGHLSPSMLDALNIPPEFKEAITPESLAKIDAALKTGWHFYTVLTDIDQNEAIFNAFYDWAQAKTINLITNVTIYQDNRSLFKFLLAANKNQTDILTAFTEIDPDGRHLFLNELAINNTFSPAEVTRKQQPVKEEAISHPPADIDSIVSSANIDTAANFMETIGKLLTSHAALRRVTESLTDIGLAQSTGDALKQNGHNPAQTGADAQIAMQSLTDNLGSLEQLTTEIGAALGQLHEMAMDMNTAPAQNLLTALSQTAKNLAQRQGKSIKLDIAGTDVKLTHNAINTLNGPAMRLLQLAVAGLQKPEQRRQAGKPADGHMAMMVSKQNSRIEFSIITDWTVPVDGNSESEGDTVAAVRAAIKTHQGRLTINDRPEGNAQFTLTLPLDQVVVDGMVARVGGVYYIVPVEVIRRIIKPEEGAITHASADGGQTLLRLEEEMVPVRQLTGDTATGDFWDRLLLVVEQNEQLVSLAVDELIGQQQVLIRPLQGYLANMRGVSGCALLSNGEVGMMLDLAETINTN